MREAGFETFAVVGHDRGGRVGYRMALDHPGRVTRLAVLDIVPTLEFWQRIDRGSALLYWHWTFLSQPAPLPERMIAADPEGFCEDYRAGATIDCEHDAASGTITCPVMALWAARGALGAFYDDVLAVWRPWAPDLRGHVIDASHFLVEDEPEAVTGELLTFLGHG